MSTGPARAVLPVTRRAQLLDALHRQGTVRVADLVGTLGVTAVTVRRDIAQLAAEGLVQRVHGGATLVRRDDADSAGAASSRGAAADGAAADGADGASAGSRGNGTDPLVGPSDDAGAPSPDRAVGMLVPSLDYYWPGVVRGAEEEARSLGMRVVLRGSSYESDDDRPHLERLLASSGADGLLVAPNMSSPRADEVVAWLAGSGVPVVLVERTATVGPHHEAVESVVTDHAHGAAMAVRHLAGLGHRRVGLVLSAKSPTARHVRAGWEQASEECGLESGTVDARVPEQRDPEWDRAIDAILDRCLETTTTALLVHSDPEAMAVVQRCEDRGLAVPGDLSVVAYDDEVAGFFSPALTAVRPPRTSVGRAAVSLLAARLADPGRPTHRVVISPTLRIRESSGPPRT